MNEIVRKRIDEAKEALRDCNNFTALVAEFAVRWQVSVRTVSRAIHWAREEMKEEREKYEEGLRKQRLRSEGRREREVQAELDRQDEYLLDIIYDRKLQKKIV